MSHPRAAPVATRAQPAAARDAVVRSPSRLAAVAAADLLETDGATDAFDRLTRLACRILGTPVSLVTLLDAEAQHFISAALPRELAHLRGTPMSHSICQHAITLGDTLALEDAHADAVFRDHPAVTEIGIRAYLGTPFYSVEGEPLGAVCAIDMAPRTWAPEDVQLVRDLSALTIAELQRRRAEQQVVRVEAEKAALLEQAARTRAEFLTVMGREVRSPLTAIMGQAALLLEDGADGMVRDVLQSVHDAANQVNALITEMLQVAELDAERLDVGSTAHVRLTEDIRHLLRRTQGAAG